MQAPITLLQFRKNLIRCIRRVSDHYIIYGPDLLNTALKLVCDNFQVFALCDLLLYENDTLFFPAFFTIEFSQFFPPYSYNILCSLSFPWFSSVIR